MGEQSWRDDHIHRAFAALEALEANRVKPEMLPTDLPRSARISVPPHVAMPD